MGEVLSAGAAPVPVHVLNGGLNNQLLHASQLLSQGCFDPSTVFLNDGSQFYTRRRAGLRSLRFSDVFELDDASPCLEHWRLKAHGAGGCNKLDLAPINRKWYSLPGLVPAEVCLYSSIRLANRLLPHVVERHTVVHPRVERDWKAFMCGKSPEHCPNEEWVARKVADPKAVLVLSQNTTAPAMLRALQLLFPAGIIPIGSELSYTEQTAVSMEIAVRAQVFWGNSYSTFARGVALMRKHRFQRRSYAIDCGKVDPRTQRGAMSNDPGWQALESVACGKCPENVDWEGIEPLLADQHFRGWGKNEYFKRVPQHYLGTAQPGAFDKCKRRVYIDLGARKFDDPDGMVGMLRLYPALRDFDEFVAVEAGEGFYELPKGEKDLSSVLVKKALMDPSRAATFRERHRFLHNFIGVQQNSTTQPPTIGINDFLRNDLKLKPNDAVVIKMDVEGSEYDIIDAMLQSGAAPLVDEMMIEVHYDHPKMRRLYRWCSPSTHGDGYIRSAAAWCSKSLEDATELYKSVRREGIYGHHWP